MSFFGSAVTIYCVVVSLLLLCGGFHVCITQCQKSRLSSTSSNCGRTSIFRNSTTSIILPSWYHEFKIIFGGSVSVFRLFPVLLLFYHQHQQHQQHLGTEQLFDYSQQAHITCHKQLQQCIYQICLNDCWLAILVSIGGWPCWNLHVLLSPECMHGEL